MKAIFVNDPNNIGDALSAPKNYFSVCAQSTVMDLRLYTCKSPDEQASYLGDAIIGGGGLLFHTIRPVLTTLLQQPQASRLVIWGVGMNTHDSTSPDYPKFLSAFDLVGVRDWGSPYTYVPCASCMHPAFDASYPEAVHDVVFYEHRQQPIDLNEPGIPRSSNRHAASQLSDVLRFMASGRTVLTNTYHGAYWAMLLGRPVIVYKPFSNRFYGFKPKMCYVDSTNWQQHLGKVDAIPRDYLEECRQCNIRFSKQVELLFS